MVYPSSSKIGLIASKNNSLYGPGDVPTVIVSFSSTAESSLPPQAARITKSIAEAAINNIFRLFNFTPPFSTSKIGRASCRDRVHGSQEEPEREARACA